MEAALGAGLNGLVGKVFAVKEPEFRSHTHQHWGTETGPADPAACWPASLAKMGEFTFCEEILGRREVWGERQTLP